jgi:hypothetical protein
MEEVNKKQNEDPKVKLMETEKGALKVLYWQSKKWLEDVYGVSDLTTIEAARLRDIIKEVLIDGKAYVDLAQKEGETNPHFGRNMYSLYEEAAGRWLNYLYDLRINDLPSTYLLNDSRYKAYHCKDKYELDKKIEELKKRGEKEFVIIPTPTEESKKYIKILRDRAHNWEYDKPPTIDTPDL